jgi:hypothetical protein
MDDDIKINALERPCDEENFGIPLRWEPEHVGRRLVKAFTTLDRLPRDRGPREPGGHWPKHAVEWTAWHRRNSTRRNGAPARQRGISPSCGRVRSNWPRWKKLSTGCANCALSIPAWRSSQASGHCARPGANPFAVSAPKGNGRRTRSIANAPRRLLILPTCSTRATRRCFECRRRRRHCERSEAI